MTRSAGSRCSGEQRPCEQQVVKNRVGKRGREVEREVERERSREVERSRGREVERSRERSRERETHTHTHTHTRVTAHETLLLPCLSPSLSPASVRASHRKQRRAEGNDAHTEEMDAQQATYVEGDVLVVVTMLKGCVEKELSFCECVVVNPLQHISLPFPSLPFPFTATLSLFCHKCEFVSFALSWLRLPLRLCCRRACVSDCQWQWRWWS